MKLDQISVRRLHGRITTTIPTSRPVLLTGPNGAGKSSVLGAALAVMLCDASRYGPQAPGAVIEVRLDGHDHRMTLTKPPAHAVDDVPRPVKAVEAERSQVIGAAGRWDLDGFLKASANKRATFVAEEILRTAWSVQEIDAALATGRESTSMLEIMRRIRSAREARGETADEVDMLKKFEGLERPLDGLLSVLDREINETQQLVLRLRRAVDQDATDLATMHVPPGTVAHWRERADTIGKQIADIEAAQRVASTAQAAAQQAAATLTQLRADIEADERAVADLVTRLSSNDDLGAEVQALKAQLDAQPKPDAERLAQAEIDLQGAQAAVTRAASTAAVKKHEEQSGRALRRLLLAARTVASFFEHEDDDPVLLDAVAQMRGASAELSLPASAEDVAAALEAVAAAESRAAEAKQFLDALRAESGRLEQERSRVERALRDAETRALYARVNRDGCQDDLDRKRQRIAAMRARLAELERQAAEPPTVPEADPELLAALKASRREAQCAADALNDAQQAETQLSTRRQRVADVERLAGALRINRATVLDARTRLVKQIANPLEQIAGAVARNVLGVDLAVRNGEVVLSRGGAEYAIDTASDGERVVLLAGLAIAVRHRLGGWKHAMIDRLDALTADLRVRFLRELYRLHEEGLLDTLIVAVHGTAEEHAAAADIGYHLVTLGATP